MSEWGTVFERHGIFQSACKCTSTASLEYLFNRLSIDRGEFPLWDSSEMSVPFLIKEGFRVNEESSDLLYWAAKYGKLEQIKSLVKNYTGSYGEDGLLRPLKVAVEWGHWEIVVFLCGQLKSNPSLDELLPEMLPTLGDPEIWPRRRTPIRLYSRRILEKLKTLNLAWGAPPRVGIDLPLEIFNDFIRDGMELDNTIFENIQDFNLSMNQSRHVVTYFLEAGLRVPSAMLTERNERSQWEVILVDASDRTGMYDLSEVVSTWEVDGDRLGFTTDELARHIGYLQTVPSFVPGAHAYLAFSDRCSEVPASEVHRVVFLKGFKVFLNFQAPITGNVLLRLVESAPFEIFQAISPYQCGFSVGLVKLPTLDPNCVFNLRPGLAKYLLSYAAHESNIPVQVVNQLRSARDKELIMEAHLGQENEETDS